jgi:hypothetical protein
MASPSLDHYQAILDRMCEAYHREGEEASNRIWDGLDNEAQEYVFILTYRMLSSEEQEQVWEDLRRMVREDGIEAPE